MHKIALSLINIRIQSVFDFFFVHLLQNLVADQTTGEKKPLICFQFKMLYHLHYLFYRSLTFDKKQSFIQFELKSGQIDVPTQDHPILFQRQRDQLTIINGVKEKSVIS